MESYNPDAPAYEVESVIKFADSGKKERLTMPAWSNLALSLLADYSLSRGHIGHEAIQYPVKKDSEPFSDSVADTTRTVVAQIDEHVDCDVYDIINHLGDTEPVVADYQDYLSENEQYVNPAGVEQEITSRPGDRVEQAGLYLIPAYKPSGRGLGDLVADNLAAMLASPWSSRLHRLQDLQALLTVVRKESWSATENDWVTELRNVADSDKKGGSNAIRELANAVADVVDDNSDDDEWKPVNVDGGQIVDINTHILRPQHVLDENVKQRASLRADVVSAVARYVKHAHSVDLRKKSTKSKILDIVLGKSSDYLIDQYSDDINAVEHNIALRAYVDDLKHKIGATDVDTSDIPQIVQNNKAAKRALEQHIDQIEDAHDTTDIPVGPYHQALTKVCQSDEYISKIMQSYYETADDDV